MTIAKALLTVYVLGVILMGFAVIGLNTQRPRNYAVPLWIDIVGRIVAVVSLAIFWPIEIGRSFYNVLTEPADVVK